MSFSNTNILPTVPARWILYKATMTTNKITIEPEGYAKLEFTKYDLPKLRDKILCRFVTDNFRLNFGLIETVATFVAVTTTHKIVHRTIPLNDHGKSLTELIMLFSEETYDTASLTFSSQTGVSINSWAMYLEEESGDITDVIDGIKKEIPKLLTNFNYSAIALDTTEKPVASITAYLSQAGELQGHLQVRCVATLACNLVVRIFDNDIQELFTPIEFALKRGYNSISIPHAYVGKRAIGTHTFLVTAQTDTSEALIDTRGVLYTIDSGYMAEYLADVGFDIADMTIEHPLNEYEPTRIFAIGIDDGVAHVRSRPYSSESLAVWQPEFSIPNVAKCAIEFDGSWVLDDDLGRFVLHTQEQPKVFFVDTSGNLYTQLGDNLGTKNLLDTDVTTLSVCRGWKSQYFLDKDQGLLVLYLKLGQLFIRNYCSDSLGAYQWETPVAFSPPIVDVISFNINRTNDYRLLVTVTTSEGICMYLSDRQYVGQGAGTESCGISISTFETVIDTLEYIYSTAETVEQSETTVASDSLAYRTDVSLLGAEALPALTVVSTERVDATHLQIVFDKDILVSKVAYNAVFLSSIGVTVTPIGSVGNGKTLTIQHTPVDIKNSIGLVTSETALIQYQANSEHTQITQALMLTASGDNTIKSSEEGFVTIEPIQPSVTTLPYSYSTTDQITESSAVLLDSTTLTYNVLTTLTSEVPV